jgi:peptide/nickel transport system permease protein
VSAAAEAPQLPVVVGKKPATLFWERFRQDKAALAGGIVIIVMIFLAIFGGPLAVKISGHGPNEVFQSTMTNDFGEPLGPNKDFWFGSDGEARDLFVRTMYGIRASLIVGLLASGIALIFGTIVGLAAGFFGGVTDTALSRTGDVMLSLPTFLIAVGVAAACGTTKEGCLHGLIQPGLSLVVIVVAFFSWAYIARLVRGFTLSLREKDFVEAARAVGAGSGRIVGREIFPNLVGPLIVYATLLVPQSILFEAALSYLGLGLPPDQASLGQLLSETAELYNVAWWITVFPGVFLIGLVLAFNLLGDGLSDALDVRSDR